MLQKYEIDVQRHSKHSCDAEESSAHRLQHFGIWFGHSFHGKVTLTKDEYMIVAHFFNYHLLTFSFMTELANSGWLKHINGVLETSAFIAKCITDGYPVVVHCSDGWDRTSQTCALACLMLVSARSRK